MSVGHNIKRYRKSIDITQKELADKIGVTPQAISSWEKDRTEPNFEFLTQLAHAFSCSTYDLLDKNDPLSIQVNTLLTEKEYAIVHYFRNADASVREMMLNMVGYVDWRNKDEN